MMHTLALCLVFSLFTSTLAYPRVFHRRDAYPDGPNPPITSRRLAGPKPNYYEQDNPVHSRMAYAKKDQHDLLFAHDSPVFARNLYPFSVYDHRLSRRSPHYSRFTSTLSRRTFGDEGDEDHSPGGYSGPHAPFKDLRGRPPLYPQRGFAAPPFPSYPPPTIPPPPADYSPPLNIKQGAWRTLHPQLDTVQRTSPVAYPPTSPSHHESNSPQSAFHAADSPPAHSEQTSPYPSQAHHMLNIPPSAFEIASAAKVARPSEGHFQDMHHNAAGIENNGPVTRAAAARLHAQMLLEESGKRKSGEIYPGYMINEHMAAAKKKKKKTE